METSLNISVRKLLEVGGCKNCATKLKSIIGDKEVEVGKAILAYRKNHSWYDCVWFLSRALNRENKIRLACYCCNQVLPAFESRHPDDKTPRNMINAARGCAKKNAEEDRFSFYFARPTGLDSYVGNFYDYCVVRSAYGACFCAGCNNTTSASIAVEDVACHVSMAANNNNALILRIIKYGIKLLRQQDKYK